MSATALPNHKQPDFAHPKDTLGLQANLLHLIPKQLTSKRYPPQQRHTRQFIIYGRAAIGSCEKLELSGQYPPHTATGLSLGTNI